MSVSALQYVDDVCLLAPSAAALQANLDIYVKHARKWRYVLVPDKFQIVPFGRGAHGDEEWNIPTPTGVQKVQSGPTAEYLSAVLDKQRSSLAHIRRAGVGAVARAPILSRIAHRVGEEAAEIVQGAAVEPHCLYGTEALWASDAHLAELDLTVSARCSSRSHLLPKYARKEAGMYTSNTLLASNKVTLAQARLALK